MFNLSRTTSLSTEGAAPAAANPPFQGMTPPGERKLVLVVDDNALTRVLMGTRLRDAGFSVEVGSIVPMTAERTEQLRPDAVMLNLNLHEKAGLELLRQLRKVLPAPGTPVFALADVHAGRLESKAEKLGLTRVFQSTGSRPQEIIKALIDWFAPHPPRPIRSPENAPAKEPGSATAAPAAEPSPTSADAATTDSRIASVRRGLQTFARCLRLADQPQALTTLLAAVDGLTAAAETASQLDLAMTSHALASLVRELIALPAGINAATRRTLAQSVDFLQVLGKVRSSTSGKAAAELSAIVIEAQTTQRMTMFSVLQETGFTPRLFGNPVAALPFLDRNPADLIVLNVTLPDACGYDVAATLREMPRHAATPLLFVTGRDVGEAASYVVLHGASDVVTEPISTAELALKALLLGLKRRSERLAPCATLPARIAPPIAEPMTVPTPAIAPESAAPLKMEAAPEATPLPQPDLTPAAPAIIESNESILTRRGVVQVDDSWGLCSINEDGAALLGCPTASLGGRNLREWIILGLPASPAEAWSTPAALNSESGAATTSLILRRQDGTMLPARLRLQKLAPDGNARWIVMLCLESEPSAGGETTILSKTLPAAETGQAALAPAATAPHPQSAMLRQRLDELLTISTSDASDANDTSEPAIPAMPASDAGELSTVDAIGNSSIKPASEECPTPAEPAERDNTLDRPLNEILPENQSTPSIEVFAPGQPEAPTPVADDEPAEVPAPAARAAILPATQLTEPETMKPHPESAPESGASAWSLADVNATLTNEPRELRQQHDESQHLVVDLEARLQVNMTALATATAQVQREQSERRRQEQRAAHLSKRLDELHEDLKQHLQSEEAAREKSAALEQQLEQHGEAGEQMRADLEREVAEMMALREELDSLTGINQALREQIRHLESTTGELGATQQDLENRLQASTAALAEAKEKTARETEERARMETLLNKVREEAGAEARRSSLELARLRASLQAETLHRHRLESEALQARGKIGEAERASTSALSRFQQRLRTPVFALVQSVGRLLEQDLSPEQREIADAMLANAAMALTNLQDLGSGLNARRTNASAAPAAAVDESPPLARGNGESAILHDAWRTAPLSDTVKQF